MPFNEDQFAAELRQLIDRHITSSSTFCDYVLITTELEEAKLRLDEEAEKFAEEGAMNGA